jgi:hypothetical protein
LVAWFSGTPFTSYYIVFKTVSTASAPYIRGNTLSKPKYFVILFKNATGHYRKHEKSMSKSVLVSSLHLFWGDNALDWLNKLMGGP